MKRKVLLSLFSMLLMLSVFLAGCSDKESAGGSSDEKVTLKIWSHPFMGGDDIGGEEKVFWENVISNYEKENKNVEIDLQILPWANREEKILTALASKNGPDAFYSIPDQLAQYVSMNILAPVNDHVDKATLEDYNESALNVVTYDGKTYGLPMLNSVMTYYYNLDLIKAAGGDPNNLPKTWDELEALGPKVKEQGKFLINFSGGGTPNMSIYPFIWQAGGDIISKKGEVMVNSPESEEAYEYINGLFKAGYLSKDTATETDGGIANFMAGKLAVLMYPNNFVPANRDKDLGFEWGIGPILENKEQVTYGTTGSFVVPTSSKHQKEAAKFIEYLTNTENMSAFCKMAGYIPPRKSAADIYEGDELMSKLVEQAKVANAGVLHPVGRKIGPDVQSSFQKVLLGESSPKDAIKALEEKIQATIDQEG
jgi:multiple sugar transport system substrate-binding protein